MKSLAIVTDANICKFTVHDVPDRPGAAAELFGHLGAEGINVLMMASSGAELGRTDISMTVATADAERMASLLESSKAELNARTVSRKTDVAAISLVAEGLQRVPGVAGRMFRTLSGRGINIDMISAANSAVTCLIDARFLSAASGALETEFHQELSGH